MVEHFDSLIAYSYLVAAALFILGLKRLGSPATARSGNLLAAIGMLVAVSITLLDKDILRYELIVIGVAIGSLLGAILARTIKMTAMPQMVAIFNGVGGAASALIASSEFLRHLQYGTSIPAHVSLTIALGTVIGIITFSGSIVAFGKLQDLIETRPVTFPLQRFLSSALFFSLVLMTGYLTVVSDNLIVFIVLSSIAALLGILLVVRIGGADMPVIISLLNSYSGLAAAAAGFALNNLILIIAGAFVGAAGIILTRIMTTAMNRSLGNVMFGAFGSADVPEQRIGGSEEQRPVHDTTAQDAAVLLAYANSVIFIPGYGLAVAQAQHRVRELGDLLEDRGVSVKYAIHPVAGRMPGHMNVLLAEANVPYEKLFDLEQINEDFARTDVTVVIGANDVVNPAARNVPESPIFGMPILNADHSNHVIVLKRTMNTGFAGIENDLFYTDNTLMLFGDARESVTNLIQAVKTS
jgi:NAD(P) transhydrogenase subunit beta